MVCILSVLIHLLYFHILHADNNVSMHRNQYMLLTLFHLFYNTVLKDIASLIYDFFTKCSVFPLRNFLIFILAKNTRYFTF